MGYICILTYETSRDAHHNHFPGAIVQWLGGVTPLSIFFLFINFSYQALLSSVLTDVERPLTSFVDSHAR